MPDEFPERSQIGYAPLAQIFIRIQLLVVLVLNPSFELVHASGGRVAVVP